MKTHDQDPNLPKEPIRFDPKTENNGNDFSYAPSIDPAFLSIESQ